MKLFLFIGLFAVSSNAQQERRFPDDFLFGAATASYQIEGAWNVDGKGESIWDRMTHTKPHLIKDMTNGDIAANSYYNYKRDVEMIRELGLDAYRFSISWPRILPNPLAPYEVNQAGVDFYNNYINEMLKYNITPMATIYHWDLPQKLQDLGGLLSPMFPEWFEHYARVVYEKFGDRVKLWTTFNEPREMCLLGYGGDEKAPFLNLTDIGTYYCAKNLLLAHARAYHAYNNDFKPTQNGECGIVINISWIGPLTDSEEDNYAAELKRQAEWGIYAEPIFSEQGGFPKEFAEVVAQKSIEQGYATSRLPELTEEERKFIQGSFDFLGINHYTGYLVSANEYKTANAVPSLLDDADVGVYISDDWLPSASDWLKMVPDSLYNLLTHLKDKYNNPPVYITESGWSEVPETGLIDDERILFYRTALNNALDCLEAGVNLKGYMAWSLMDNYEWIAGYTELFGLYEVDFKSEAKTRTPRKSAFVYKQIVKTRVIDPDYEPTDMVMTIDEGH
ncbi:unnamed protein product [Euphydryas editha]|uniref:Cytosolic beta-glucosidase n=1 Tax=Euphydryas editha TaxID=104508 RepID=A0AAU9UAM7_EUPED|nr:unnamed protein product [Euphydryas editha]